MVDLTEVKCDKIAISSANNCFIMVGRDSEGSDLAVSRAGLPPQNNCLIWHVLDSHDNQLMHIPTKEIQIIIHLIFQGVETIKMCPTNFQFLYHYPIILPKSVQNAS
jgi:hypothetical protein